MIKMWTFSITGTGLSFDHEECGSKNIYINITTYLHILICMYDTRIIPDDWWAAHIAIIISMLTVSQKNVCSKKDSSVGLK